jgi:hypothetical protein
MGLQLADFFCSSFSLLGYFYPDIVSSSISTADLPSTPKHILTSWISTRKVDLIIAQAVAGIGASAHKIANDIRLLANFKEIEVCLIIQIMKQSHNLATTDTNAC